VRSFGRILKRLHGPNSPHGLRLLSSSSPSSSSSSSSLFHLPDVDLTCHNCPSVRGTLTANAISMDCGIFNGRSVLISGKLLGCSPPHHNKVPKNTDFVDPIMLNVSQDLPCS
jgi:hypothetical protein